MHRPSQRPLRLLVIALAGFLTVPGASFVIAAPAPTPAQIASKRAAAKQAEAELRKMRADLSAGLASYNRVAASLDRTDREIADNTARLTVLQKRLGSAQQGLDTRADYMYRTNGTGLLDVLFSAATFDDFVTRLDLVTQVATHDARLVVEIKDARAELSRLRGTLAERRAMLASLQSKAASERARLQGQVDVQQARIGSLDADVARMVRDAERAAAPKSAPSSGGGHSGSGGGPVTGTGGDLVAATVVQHPGRRYWAMKGEATTYSADGVSFSGEASVYSVAENGHGTASGHPLDDSELTCAHRTLPFGTRIAVSRGGHHIIVVVTDRGPYTGGRVLDLTKRGASILGLDGVGNVTCEVVRGQ